MAFWMIAAALAALAAVWFVLSPLVRSEDDLDPLVRPRSGTRRLAGPVADETPRSTDEAEIQDRRRCPHCGETVEREYTFCGSCVQPLPT